MRQPGFFMQPQQYTHYLYNYNMFKARNFLVAGILLFLMYIPAQSSTASPAEPLTIITPGEGSVLSSPIHLITEVQLDPGDFIRVTLTNGSNFPISRQLYRVSESMANSTTIEWDIPFEIPTDTARASLSVSILDNHHRPKSLRSVPLTLTMDGLNMDETQANHEPWLVLRSPVEGEIISGGQFIISGTVMPPLETPVLLELISDTGGTIGYAFLAVDTPGEPLDFDLKIHYDFITSARDVRLIILQTSKNFSESEILDSVALTLLP